MKTEQLYSDKQLRLMHLILGNDRLCEYIGNTYDWVGEDCTSEDGKIEVQEWLNNRLDEASYEIDSHISQYLNEMREAYVFFKNTNRL
jgi:5-hydroxyisourate hydrolase-like protein (transthyretin family)